jgi:hypothetical protein
MTAADLIDSARRIRRDSIGALGLVALVIAPVWLVLAWAWTHQRRERGR